MGFQSTQPQQREGCANVNMYVRFLTTYIYCLCIWRGDIQSRAVFCFLCWACSTAFFGERVRKNPCLSSTFPRIQGRYVEWVRYEYLALGIGVCRLKKSNEIQVQARH